MAAEAWGQALGLGQQIRPNVPEALRLSFERNLLDRLDVNADPATEAIAAYAQR